MEHQQGRKVTIFNVLGVKVYEEVLKTGANSLRIDNQNLGDGIYFYTLQNVSTSEIIDKQKVIISK